MAMSRRKFLQGLGAVSVVVAGGGVYRAADQGVFSVGNGPAYEPWTNWRTQAAEGPLRLVQSGILASNPHNSQPWRFDVSENRIDVYADTARSIGTVDPFLREMYTGVGCALENMMLTAAAVGYTADIELMPSASDPSHTATITLTEGTPNASALYRAIPNRHTNRGAYDQERPVSQAMLDDMAALSDMNDIRVMWLDTETQKTRFVDGTLAAAEALIADVQQQEDSDKWVRHTWDEVHQEGSGITYDAQQMGVFLTTFAKMGTRLSPEAAGPFFVDATERHLAGATAFGILLARDVMDNSQRLQGGRYWQRLHLWGTDNGLGMQPLNQTCERADRERQLEIEPTFTNVLAELVNDSNWTALMPFRFGYPIQQALPSPRRPVEAVLV